MLGKLTQEEIESVLQSNLIGRLGCSDGKRVYVVPVNYIYHDGSIIGHSLLGTKINMMRKNPDVCFEVDEIVDQTNWKSVIAWGIYEEIKDEKERQEAMHLFVDRTLRMKVSETAALPENVAFRVHPRSAGNINFVVYRITLTDRSGRFEKS